MGSIRLLIALALEKRKLAVQQMDVVAAHLNREVDEEIYMDVSEGLDKILPESTNKCDRDRKS